MKLNAGGSTHVGLVRDHNEDAFLLDGPLFVVADGMGGHNGGEVASGTTIETFHGARKGLAVDPNPVTRLAEVAQAANRAVFSKASGDPELARMGTTLTAAMARDGRLFIAHVGDSRCYRLRDGRLDQLTVDHTLVGEFVREGRITEEQARTHPQRSIITRALGVEPAVPIDSITLEVANGDRFLICSDGLYGMLYDEEILSYLTAVPEPQQCAEQLIDAANRAGGEDNTTVIIVDILDSNGNGRKPIIDDEWPTDQMRAVGSDPAAPGPVAIAVPMPRVA